MSEIDKAISTLKEIIPTLKETPVKKVNQAGIYLYLDNITPSGRNVDILSLNIIIAGNTLVGSPSSIISLANDVRESLRKAENEFSGLDVFKKISSLDSESSLYIYVMTVEIDVTREILHSEIF